MTIDYSAQFQAIENAAHDGAFGHNARPTPTDNQCLAGNYKVGRVSIHGMPVAIEQPRNSYRTGLDPKTGQRWSSRLAAHYGYFAGTKGADGDPVDCFIGPYPQAETAWIINQHVGGGFDEHKVMLCFPDEETARRAYLDSYERGWPGLHSIIPASISQLRWWLKNGNLTRPLKPDHLPYEGLETMNQRIIWDSAQPKDLTFAQLLYQVRRSDGDEGLILDSVGMADILAEADEIMMLDALVTPYARLQRKMEVLQTVMERVGGEIKPVALQVSEPYKQGGVAQVAAVFELSDGQTISIFFHNPDVTPAKIAPTDELISWKWLLNKNDITIVVAPEKGDDLNVKIVAERIIKLAEKNSPAFQRANTKRAENLAAIDTLKTEITGLEKELSDAQKELELVKFEADNKAIADVEAKKAADAELSQQILQSLIDDYGWQNQGMEGKPLSWVTKTIGGGREGGVVNPNGDRRVSAKVQGDKLVALWGDNPLVSVDLDREAAPKDNAGKLDAAVNAEDPRYVAPVDDTMTYDEFKLEYERLFKEMNKYDIGQAGSNIFAGKMADLVDKYPEFEKRLDNELETTDPIPELPQGDQPAEPDITEDERYERDDVIAVNEDALLRFVMKNRFESDAQTFDEFLEAAKDPLRPDLDYYKLINFAETAFLVKKAVAEYGGVVAFGNFNASAYSADLFDSAILDKANQAPKAVVGGIVGQIASAEGKIIARFRIEENGMLTMYKGASGLERVASPTMAVSRINGTVSALFGGEANKLKEPNLGLEAGPGSAEKEFAYSDKVQFDDGTGRPTFGDKQACFVEWKSGKKAIFGALVGASDFDKKEFGLGVFRQGKGEFVSESIVKIDPVGMKIYFVDQSHYMTTDEVKWGKPVTLTRLTVFNRALFEKAFDQLTDEELAALEPVVDEVDSGDMRGMAFAIEKDGKLITSGSIPKLSEKGETTDIAYYKKIADSYGGNLYVGNISAARKEKPDGLIFGMTWEQLQDRQNRKQVNQAVKTKMPDDAVLVYSAENGQPENSNQPHIDTLQAIADGQHDGEDLNSLLDKIDAAAAVLEAAGLAEQYDELIGKAATKWAELDQKANG